MNYDLKTFVEEYLDTKLPAHQEEFLKLLEAEERGDRIVLAESRIFGRNYVKLMYRVYRRKKEMLAGKDNEEL